MAQWPGQRRAQLSPYGDAAGVRVCGCSSVPRLISVGGTSGVVDGPFGRRGVGRVGVRVGAVEERLGEGADAERKVSELVVDADVPVGVVLEDECRGDIFPDNSGRGKSMRVSFW